MIKMYFLSMLIQARNVETGMALSEEELLGHTSVIFAAGHETIANALVWTLFLLSQHPQVATDLLNELESPITLKSLERRKSPKF
ncbi:MAG: cytochrome P450 [Rhizonema sp. PD37]|nr:cytochrome P450 [Rhizonema sp. PD37]